MSEEFEKAQRVLVSLKQAEVAAAEATLPLHRGQPAGHLWSKAIEATDRWQSAAKR